MSHAFTFPIVPKCDTMFPSWLIGVFFCLLSCFMNTTGMLVQKYFHMAQAADHIHSNFKFLFEFYHHIHSNPKFHSQEGGKAPQNWIALSGVAMMICGGLLDFVALGYAAQSIIAPLGAFSLVLNALLSPVFIGEEITSTDWIATLIISAGCTTATVFGAHSSTDMTVYILYGIGVV